MAFEGVRLAPLLYESQSCAFLILQLRTSRRRFRPDVRSVIYIQSCIHEVGSLREQLNRSNALNVLTRGSRADPHFLQHSPSFAAVIKQTAIQLGVPQLADTSEDTALQTFSRSPRKILAHPPMKL